jgi:hypothetical protein
VSDDAEATRRATQDMVRVLGQNSKFRDSEFFDFMSKVSSGELKFENNTVVQDPVRQRHTHSTPAPGAGDLD